MFEEIESFLFDLDDTLISTHQIFQSKVKEAVQYLAKRKNIDLKIISNSFSEASQQAYEKYSINQELHWGYVVDVLSKDFTIDSNEKLEILSILKSVNTTVPEVYEGSHDLLKYVRSKYKCIALVTHAEEDWTTYKLKSTGLDKYFDDIYLVNVNEHKGKKHWLEASEKFGIDRKRSCVVGDSVAGDIVPAYELGYSKQVHVKSGLAWRVNSDFKIPRSTVEVNNPKELLQLLTSRKGLVNP